MSVYDELMNEEVASPANPLSRGTGNTGRIGTALSRSPSLRARWKKGGEPTSPAELRAQGRYSSQRNPMTGPQKTEFRRRWSGDTGATRKDPATGQMVQTQGAKAASTGAGATFRRPGTAYAMRSGTTYEGPSLREKVEYIARFLEEGKFREKLRRQGFDRTGALVAAMATVGMTGIGANAISHENARRAEAEAKKQTPPAITAPETPGKASKKPEADDLVQKINRDYRQSREIRRRIGKKNK
tara:strand:- start:1377 stop:2105 length:729 start_codon:yes stop_codon:yes gene_type:complete